MTLANRYTSSSHSVYNLGYHIVFCPKYRRKVLVDGIDERLKELLMEKAKELDLIIESMEVMPDHVHLFIRSYTYLCRSFCDQSVEGIFIRLPAERISMVA